MPDFNQQNVTHWWFWKVVVTEKQSIDQDARQAKSRLYLLPPFQIFYNHSKDPFNIYSNLALCFQYRRSLSLQLGHTDPPTMHIFSNYKPTIKPVIASSLKRYYHTRFPDASQPLETKLPVTSLLNHRSFRSCTICQ